MIPRFLTGLLILGIVAVQPVALADVEVRTSVGESAVGNLKADVPLRVQSTPISLALSLEKSAGFLAHCNLGGVFQHQIIAYQEDGSTYSGTNLLIGPTVGLSLINFDASFLRIEGVYYPYNVMTLSSNTSAAVNNQVYSHSTLTTFQGPGAEEVKVVYMIEKTDGQYNKHERLRYGLQLTELQQPIKKAQIKVASSNPSLQPISSTDHDVNYSLSLTTIAFIMGFAF